MQLLFSCQQNQENNVMCHPVYLFSLSSGCVNMRLLHWCGFQKFICDKKNINKWVTGPLPGYENNILNLATYMLREACLD